MELKLKYSKPLLPSDRTNLSDWADKNFYLSRGSSHTTGQWKSYPFQIGWMDAFSNDNIEEVIIRKSRRVGYTKTLLAFIAFNAACRCRVQTGWWPTDEDRTRFVKDELDPMLLDVEAANKVLERGRTYNTIRRKQFIGCHLNILGGKSARAYRGITTEVAMLDEISAFDKIIEGALNPVDAARGRLEGCPFPKLIIGSTPRVKGDDHIDKRADNADAVMYYYIKCPRCKDFHRLYFGGKKKHYGFKGGGLGADVGPITHVCPYCKYKLTQRGYLSIYHSGKWMDKDKKSLQYGQDRVWRDMKGKVVMPPATVSFSIWAGYSPQRDWRDIVKEFKAAAEAAKEGDTSSLQVFLNETLGESWEPTYEKTEEHVLMRRAESYDRFCVPKGGIILCTGIDTQIDRWEAVTWAYGRAGEMWCVDYSVLRGNPGDPQEWVRVIDSYLNTPFIHESGVELKIRGVAIDVMGGYTHTAYGYCRLREHKRVYAIRGHHMIVSRLNCGSSSQDVNCQGAILRNGVRLWSVGVNVAKDLFFERCKITKPGPGYVHFYDTLPPGFYAGLTTERKVRQKTYRGPVYRWVNPYGRAVEPLDCTVYSLFVAEVFNLNCRSAEAWDRLEERVLSKKSTDEVDNNKKNTTENSNNYGKLRHYRHNFFADKNVTW